MKKINVSLIIIIFISFFHTSIFGYEYQGKSRSFTVSKGGKLEVNINSGDIHINVWDKNEVLVKVQENEEQSGKISMTQSGNTVKITDYESWGNANDYRITVPNQFNLDIKTSSGDLFLTGTLTGQVTARTNGGDITLGNIGGNIDVNTSGGDIHVGDISGRADINTMGGDIYAGNVTGEVKVQTMGGTINIKNGKSRISAITYGGDIKMGSAGSDIVTTTYGGNIEVGAVSGSAKVDTYGGDIVVKGADGNVDAKTAGGDIRLFNITGSINAKTSSGDVTAELIPGKNNSSKIYSANGRITLSIPSNAKATINARIRIRGRWRDEDENHEIHSEFNAVKYTKENNGKDIVASYEINGGGEVINLETINSEIFIKKLAK